MLSSILLYLYSLGPALGQAKDTHYPVKSSRYIIPLCLLRIKQQKNYHINTISRVKNAHLAKIYNKTIVWHIITAINLLPQGISVLNTNYYYYIHPA